MGVINGTNTYTRLNYGLSKKTIQLWDIISKIRYTYTTVNIQKGTIQYLLIK